MAAILLLPAAVLIPTFIKKRSILSINKGQVLLILTVAALAFVMIYYLTGLKFGFYKNPYRLTVTNFFKYVLPIATIIVTTEIIRFVMVAQKSRLAHMLCYLSCVVAEMLVCSNLPSVTTFNRFMDLVAGALFPALVANFFYNYTSRRYGMYPIIAFRAIISLHTYLIPVTSGIAESLYHLFLMFLPIVLFLFIDTLFERRRRYALGNTSRFWRVMSKILTAIVVIIMVGTVMLISNQFRYGALVIATESMTGELNRGDVVIFESFESQHIPEGQVIVFEKYNTTVVHRVVDIKIINGIARYYTKGDANEDNDMGYITNAEIVGLVNYKIPVVGYPTLWLRSLFQH
jgi:signal peptidase